MRWASRGRWRTGSCSWTAVASSSRARPRNSSRRRRPSGHGSSWDRSWPARRRQGTRQANDKERVMYINGQWLSLKRTFPVYNPATGERLAEVVDGGVEQAEAAIQAASAAFPAWAATTAYQRSALLYRAYELMMQRQQELARTMTSEQGKPLRAALNEVRYGADFLLWFAEEAKRMYGEIIPSARPDQRFL